MTTIIQEIEKKFDELKLDIEKMIENKIVTSRQVRTSTLSDISPILGLIQSFEFRTPGNPSSPTYSGIQITESGIATYKNGAQTGSIQNDGDVLFGSNISSPSTTGFQIFSQDQTYNGESMGAGDILFGDNSSGQANMFWDASTKKLQFRAGTVILNELSGGALSSDGAKIRRSTQQVIAAGNIPVVFDTVVYDDSSFSNLGTYNTRLTVPTGRSGRYAVGFYAGFTANATATLSIQLNGTGASLTGLTINTGTVLTASSEAYLSAGDYIELIVTSGGLTLNTTEYRPSMWISRVR